MKTRNVLAVILALAQLVFGIVLISRGTVLDQTEEARISRIISYGQYHLFQLSSFFYYEDNDTPVSFNLKRDSTESDGRYAELIVNDNGFTHVGNAFDTAPAEEDPYVGLYIDNTKDFIYRMDANSVRSAFPENSEDHWYLPMLFGKGKFNINGVGCHVYAVGYVYEGEVVFIGIQIGQAVY